MTMFPKFGLVLTGLEALTFAATVEATIEKEILQSELKNLVAEHKKDLQLMSDIYELCQKLCFQEGLLDQLNQTQLYSLRQWQLIGRSINSQVDLVNDFLKNFKDVKIKAEDKIKTDWLNYFIISIYTLGFMKKGWEIYSGVQPTPEPIVPRQLPEGWVDMSQQSFRASIATLTSVSSIEIREEASSSSSSIMEEVNSNAAVRANLTRSKFQTMKDWAKSGLKFIGEYGVRILFIAFAVINLYRGRISLEELRQVLKNTYDFFGEKGGFQQKQEDVAVAMLAISANLFSLANVSYSVITELHCLYLTRSAIQPVNSTTYFLKAATMIPDKYNVSPQFLKSCEQFLKKCNEASSSNKNVSDRLQDLKNVYSAFLAQAKADQVFSVILNTLSSSVANDAVMSGNLHKKQNALTALLKATTNQMKELRGQNFDQKSLNQKEHIDRLVLRDVEGIYKEIILEDPNAALNPKDKETIAGILSSFTERFFGTDQKGQTIYDYNIAGKRKEFNYGDLLKDVSANQDESKVPIKLLDDQAEDKERERMVSLALKVNQEEKVLPQDFKIGVKDIQFRFTRVKMREIGKDKKKGSLSQVIGIEGAQFQFNGQTYSVEQELLSKKTQLSKVKI